MTAETPAQGILRVNDWGSSKMYQAVTVATWIIIILLISRQMIVM